MSGRLRPTQVPAAGRARYPALPDASLASIGTRLWCASAMHELEHVSEEVKQAFRELAGRVGEALSLAGLPVSISAPGALARSAEGASVYCETVADELAGVWVTWRCASALRERAAEAVARGELDSPDIQQSGLIEKTMCGTMLALLQQAGFAVRESDNDYAPFDVRVDAGSAQKADLASRHESTDG